MVSNLFARAGAAVALAASFAAHANQPHMAITPPPGAAAATAAANAGANAAAVAVRPAAVVPGTAPINASAPGLAQGGQVAPAQPVAASAAPAPAIPASGVVAPPAYNLPMGAVTIRTLSQAQARELEADARRRLGVALGGSAAAASPSQTPTSSPADGITSAKVLRIRAPEAEKPAPVPYRLVGVVGRLGEEVAEVREPSGRVSVVRPGQRLGDWVVLAVSPSRVDLGWRGKVTKKAPAKPNKSVPLGGAFL